LDLPVPAPEEMSRDELIVVVARQAGQLAAQDRQIAEMAGQLAQLMEVNEALAAKLAGLEHLLSRNSGNSSSPPSRDDDPGKPAAPEKTRRGGNPARARGKQPGAPGSHLAWIDDPHERRDRFPQGRCDCGADLTQARDLGVVDSYQAHESHRSRCGSPSTTSTGWRAGDAGGPTPPPDPTGPGPARSATGRTWPRSRST
jgi:hypothetical protein